MGRRLGRRRSSAGGRYDSWLCAIQARTLAVGSPVRYLVVGGFNTGFGLSVYWLLLYLGVDYRLASAGSLAVAIVSGFTAQGRLVFKAKGSFARYAAAWAAIYVINIALIAGLRGLIGDYAAGLALLPVTSAIGFVLMKRFVFVAKPYPPAV